jgi:8-oxo-dGTP pyrophosphatase MutT (NUDIX family)
MSIDATQRLGSDLLAEVHRALHVGEEHDPGPTIAAELLAGVGRRTTRAEGSAEVSSACAAEAIDMTSTFSTARGPHKGSGCVRELTDFPLSVPPSAAADPHRMEQFSTLGASSFRAAVHHPPGPRYVHENRYTATADGDRTQSAAGRPWEVIETQAVHDCRVFTLVKRRSRSPRTARVHDVYVLDAPDWVNIVPLTADGHVVMGRQYRHGVAGVTLENPGGMLDATDVDPGVAARREMFEETGHDSERIEALGHAHPNPAIQRNRCHTFVARDVVRRAEPQLGQMEHTEPVLVPLARIPARIRSGAISPCW